MQEPKSMIYIVIPIHNRIVTTLECLKCIAQQTHTSYQVVIVDDGSTDGSAETIREHYPDTMILKGNGTLWWTGAMHKGITYVLERATNDDYVLSLNDDVTFDIDYLQQLMTASASHPGAMVGSLCKDFLNHDEIHDAGIKIRWKVYSYYQLPYNPVRDVVTDVDTISGRGVLIPVTVFKTIGNFDMQRFPHYGGDYEFGFRAGAAGIPMVVANRAIVYLKNELTGFRPKGIILSPRETWKRLFSIKSPANILVHLKTVYYRCPLSLSIRLRIIAYLIAGNAYVALRDTILYLLQKLKLYHPHAQA